MYSTKKHPNFVDRTDSRQYLANHAISEKKYSS